MTDRINQPKHFKREVRRARRLIAKVVAPGLNVECHVVDVSQHGAKLVTDLADKLPANFELVFPATKRAADAR